MIPLESFPALNASLNGLAAVFLAVGYGFVRARRFAAHKACMMSAAVVSLLFLSCYLYYHFHAGTTRFPGQGAVRTLYLSILLSHTLLAAVNLPMAVTTLVLAFRGRLERHRKLARWTLPLWLYVSITGVVIYWMLYRMEY
jgi:putative membrane protein